MLAAPLRLSTGMIALSRPPAAAPARGWALSARVARPLAPLRPRALSNGSSSDSFDAEDGMDYRLARELDAVADPAKYKRLAGRLDLLYAATGTQAEQRSKVEQCSCCRGSGEKECDWCHGTGAMTLGDTLYCSEGGCTPCPVCRGTGACKCENCRGTGRRANWLPLS